MKQLLSTKTQMWRGRGGRCLVLTAYCLVLPLLSGCIRRSLTIRTDPPGALVYVNDMLKGRSPVTYDFAWYGWHRITIRKDGFRRLDDRKLLRCPIYFWIPFDLAMELLPLPLRDARTWSYTLTPSETLHVPVPPSASAPISMPPPPVAATPEPPPVAASTNTPVSDAAGLMAPSESASTPEPGTPPPTKESRDATR